MIKMNYPPKVKDVMLEDQIVRKDVFGIQKETMEFVFFLLQCFIDTELVQLLNISYYAYCIQM